MRVESNSTVAEGEPTALRIRLLGPPAVIRGGEDLALPASRKVRALFAYLVLASQKIPRGQLCELLWDGPSDPRGELRWCLSKIRGLVDEQDRRRLDTPGDSVRLDLTDCRVDAVEVGHAVQGGVEKIELERARALLALFSGDFLEGFELDRNPSFQGWLVAQRRRFRGCHAALLEHIVKFSSQEETLQYLEKWLELVPFDRRVHELLLDALARRGQYREGEEHLAATVSLFEAEGLDSFPIREAWRAARGRSIGATAAAASIPSSMATDAPSRGADGASRRASIAVMPFVDGLAVAGERGGAADALAHDVITRLAKLRSLFVIAQGTTFALHDRRVGSGDAGRILDVDYVVSGFVQRSGHRFSAMVELAESRTARIVWTEVFNNRLDDTFLVLDEIGNRIVASIANEIETIERNRAILRPPNSLDAWEAHHRGLWHMYRFNRIDNEKARYFFETAVALDPTFSRAYAGLSFTHFQNAFQGWSLREPEVARALEAAGQGLMVDDRDPAAHWAMGRALWLRGQHDQSMIELEQAVDLSPNFAQGLYTLAFVQSQAGDPAAAISYSDHSRHLSPFDPLLFGMLGARAMALVRLGRFEEAADYGVKAAARPNAHAHILAIAALSLALAGRGDEARLYLASIRKGQPQYRIDDFLGAMRFDAGGEELFHRGAARIGM
jgi:DNA-binding SARP family transcriptional activator